MKRYVVMVGIRCYYNGTDKPYALGRAEYWSARYPGVVVHVEERETIWDNGIREAFLLSVRRGDVDIPDEDSDSYREN